MKFFVKEDFPFCSSSCIRILDYLVSKLKTIDGICNLSNALEKIRIYQKTKMGTIHCLPSQSSQIVHKSPYELIYNDLWVPSLMLSNFGFNYYMSFVDANTRFTWFHLLRKINLTP